MREEGRFIRNLASIWCQLETLIYTLGATELKKICCKGEMSYKINRGAFFYANHLRREKLKIAQSHSVIFDENIKSAVFQYFWIILVKYLHLDLKRHVFCVF